MEESARQSCGTSIATASTAVIVFSLVFAALALLPIHVPVYIPLEHRWQPGFPDKPAVGMDFFGRVLYSLIAAGIFAPLAGALAGKVFKWTPAPDSQAVRMLAVYSAVSVCLPVFIYCYVLLFK